MSTSRLRQNIQPQSLWSPEEGTSPSLMLWIKKLSLHPLHYLFLLQLQMLKALDTTATWPSAGSALCSGEGSASGAACAGPQVLIFQMEPQVLDFVHLVFRKELRGCWLQFVAMRPTERQRREEQTVGTFPSPICFLLKALQYYKNMHWWITEKQKQLLDAGGVRCSDNNQAAMVVKSKVYLLGRPVFILR